MGCGTSAVVARISSHHELLPETLVDKVDFGDHEAAAQIAADILREKRRTSPETLTYLHAHFRVEDQLNAYADTIVKAEVVPPMQYRFAPIDETTRFILPIWCYRAPGKGIYHDYLVSYYQEAALERLLDRYPRASALARQRRRASTMSRCLVGIGRGISRRRLMRKGRASAVFHT